MPTLEVLLILLAAIALTALIRMFLPSSRIVMEHERGLRYKRGKLVGEVGPGRYWVRSPLDEIRTVDTRQSFLLVNGQEVLTADRVPLKISLVAEYQIQDATKALTVAQSSTDTLYSHLQLALREQLATRELEAALADRGEIGTALREAVAERAAGLGILLDAVHVRDFMMAGGLRTAFSDVIEARQQGVAALERARGESAAARSLANTAQLMERHPGIMQLRLLQAVEQGEGSRVVVSLTTGSGDSGVAVHEATDGE